MLSNDKHTNKGYETEKVQKYESFKSFIADFILLCINDIGFNLVVSDSLDYIECFPK